MGNSNRRASRSSEQRGTASRSTSTSSSSLRVPIIGESLFKKNVVSDKNLAPRTPTNNTENRDAECPICFVCYDALNVAICCKQSICTECYVQLKESAHRQCPFCNRESLTAEFRRSSVDHATPKPIPVETSSPATRSNAPSTTSNNSSTSNQVSKRERELLEAQIRSQRLEFFEDELSESDSRSNSVDFAPTIEGRRRGPSSPLPPNLATIPTNSAVRVPPSASDRQNRGNRTAVVQRNRFLSEDSEDRDSFDAFQHGLASSLHHLLEMDELDHIASLEQLEQMMLMEAIRQSMMESAVSNPPSSNNEASNTQQSVQTTSEEQIVNVKSNDHIATVESNFHTNEVPDSTKENIVMDQNELISSGHYSSDKSSSPLRLIEEIELALNTPPPSPLRGVAKDKENVKFSNPPKSYDI